MQYSLSRQTSWCLGITLGLLLLVGVVSILYLVLDTRTLSSEAGESAPVEANVTITKRIRYRVEVRNPQAHAVQNVTLKVLAPLPLTSSQKRLTLEADYSNTLEIDPVGNEWLLFEIPVLPPLGRKLITVTSTLGMGDQSETLEQGALDRYLVTEPHIERDDAQVQGRATGLKQATAHETAVFTQQAVREIVHYIGPISEPRGAKYALQEARGDCTEFAYLFTALMRANGIPARPVRGFVYPYDALLDPADQHDWSEYAAEGSWHLADPFKGVLRNAASSYIGMRWMDYTTPAPETDPEQMVWASAGIEARLIGRRE